MQHNGNKYYIIYIYRLCYTSLGVILNTAYKSKEQVKHSSTQS